MAIVVFYFALVLAIGWYLKGRANTVKDFFMAGRGLISTVSSPRTVPDRRDSSDAVPGDRDDAFLLHFPDAFSPRLPETSFRRIQPRSLGNFVCLHDRADERHQQVFNGAVHESCPGMGDALQHLGFLADGGGVCGARRITIGDLQ